MTAPPGRNEEVSTGYNAHKSTDSERRNVAVNQVSTQNTPSSTLNDSVNPLGGPSDQVPEGKGEVFRRVLSDGADLFGAIKEFLETKGLEVYRMEVGVEAYQVSYNGQIIRFYVNRGR